ncbi:hypothetical protein [Paraburkholderia sp. SOS3]|uniref:hypothetical protein n=1 Tax=Paraburkholderia sp. SOS3 TaxID=1926494 RepID=UPI0012EB5BF6|nr:hypothetical protein [Paraburkholderia sp. SOS3]
MPAPGSPDRDDGRFAPAVCVRSASAESAPRTELQDLGAKLREQPLLHGTSLHAAAAEQCFAIGERLRRGDTAQPIRETLAVMLDLLRARSGGGNGAPLFGDVLRYVRQTLIDTQTRLRRTPIVVPCSDTEATFNALLPLVELVNRRALTAPLAERAERHLEAALRASHNGFARHSAGKTQPF